MRVRQVARDLEIEDILPKYPYEISGGQKQRVACARAIVTKPALILADEPTGALDSKSSRMLLESLETLNGNLQATILMVTHDAFTASYCRRILFLRDGKIFNEIVRGQDTRKTVLQPHHRSADADGRRQQQCSLNSPSKTSPEA